MTLSVTPPPWLDRLDCAQLTFVLTLTEDVDLPTWGLLQLRREFSLALADLQAQSTEETARTVSQLLFPAAASDPLVQRQVQKPPAALILSPAAVSPPGGSKGEQFKLPTLFIGDGVVAIEAFYRLLKLLGQRGIHKGQGCFEVTVTSPLTTAGVTQPHAVLSDCPFYKVVPLSWLLQPDTFFLNKVKLEIITPMRLIIRGKPLFRFNFNDFLSALQRRVMQLAFAHTEVATEDNDHISERAATIVCDEESLRWQDWRHLNRGHKGQGIGGLTGTLTLSGEALADIWWIFELGALLHVGKGASYGFGRFNLLQSS